MAKDLEKAVTEKNTNNKIKNVPAKTDTEVELSTLIWNTIEKYRLYVFPEAYKIVKNKLLFAWDIKMANRKLWRPNDTAAVYPLIESTTDTFTANLYDSVSIPKVAARLEEDVSLWEYAQDFCDWAYDVSWMTQAKQMIRNEAALLWTSYWIWGWEYRTESNWYYVKWEDKKIENKISRPTADHVSFFELFIELSTTDFYKARWKARRKILSLKEIEKRYWELIKLDDIHNKISNRDKINQTKWQCISMLDFTKIYDIKNYSSCYDKEWNFSLWADRWELSFIEDNVLSSITEDNYLHEVIEYWYDDKLVIMVNWYIYYDWLSPYPYWDPFWIIVFEKVPWTFMWRGIWHKLMPLQQQATSLWCKIRDAINQHVAPMYSVVKWMLSKDSQWNTVQSITYTPWKVIQVESPDVKNWWISPVDFVNFNMVQIARDELNAVISRAQEIIGTNSYVQWWQWKVERSGIAANLKVWVTKTRLKPIEASMQQFDQHMFEQWLSIASVIVDESIMVRVIWEDWAFRYREVKPSDLLNKFDITVDVDSLIEQTRLQRTQEAISLLQAIWPININPISNTPIIDPDSIVKYIAEQTGNSSLKAMTDDERLEYVKQQTDILAKVKQAEWVQQQVPQIPQEQVLQQSEQPIDLNNVQWFM